MAINSNINRDSGSIYPNLSLLKDQLNSKGQTIVDTKSPNGDGAPLPVKTYNDMTRLGSLKVNDVTIYSPNSKIRPPPGMKNADYVFHRMESKLGSTALAIHAANLMQQDTGGGVLKAVALQKGISRKETTNYKEEEIAANFSTHSVLERERCIILTTDNSSFTLVMESLVEQRALDDPEGDLTYYKLKTTIDGPKLALENKNADKLSIKAAYTAESPTKAAALQDDYSGTRAGFWDSQSYLKA